ncbi:MAG TPA: YihY/virulence factor BrkB family protein [Aestuariivirgaceae bacterium]|nr:YihY/virulence factor BrkB family protein [Aestuariivirgaceae bacterium]
MARKKIRPPGIPDARELWELAKASVLAWNNDYAPSMGAAIAYYTLFSIAPLLIIVTAIAGFFFGEEAAQGEIFGQIRGLLGEEGALAIQGLVKSASEPAEGFLALLIGIVAMVIGATAVFGELQSAMDRIWRAPAAQQSGGIMGLFRARLFAFGMVLGVAFLLLVSLVVSAGISALGALWSAVFGGWELVLQIVNIVVSLIIFTGVFAMIYRFLPRISVSWRDVWTGAAITSVLFVIGKFLIGLYIGSSGVVSGFGAAGALAALLIWVYYSAQIFLLGAEFTWAHAHKYGSRAADAKYRKSAK